MTKDARSEDQKLPLPLVISVAVMALGASGCSGGNQTQDAGSCPSPECFTNTLADGGTECICGV